MRTILIRRLGVGSFAKFVGFANAILGLIYGILASFGAVAAIVDQDSWNFFAKVGASIAAVLASLVIIPLVSFLVGWLYGAVLALVSNLFLRTANGIELEVEELGEAATSKTK